MGIERFALQGATYKEILLTILAIAGLILFFFIFLYYYRKNIAILSEEKVQYIKTKAKNAKLTKDQIDLLIELFKKEKIKEPEIYISNFIKLKNLIIKYITIFTGEIEDPKKLATYKNNLYSILNKMTNPYSKKRKIYSTHELIENLKIRIKLFENFYYSKILKNIDEYIMIERPENISSDNYAGSDITVFFYNRNDAGYSFKTKILRDINNPKVQAFLIAHTKNLKRHQKRRFLRKKCDFNVLIVPIEIVTKGTRRAIEPIGTRLAGTVIDVSPLGCQLELHDLNEVEFFKTHKTILIEMRIESEIVRIIGLIVNISRERFLHIKFLKILEKKDYVINDFIYLHSEFL